MHNSNIRQTIEDILVNDALDQEFSDADTSKVEEIEKLISELGWEVIEKEFLDLLRDDRRTQDYETLAGIIWGACLDNRTIRNPNKVIALLHKRLPPDPKSSENNLVWSIITRLKGIEYLSDYNPLNDPGVLEELHDL